MLTALVPYKKWIIGGVILLLLLWAYFAFANKGDKKNDETSSCPSSFTLHPLGGFIQDALSVTYSMNGDKYFSQTSGGYLGYSAQIAPKEISKEAFLKACKEYKSTNPA